jgi:hypothetical protein
MTRFRRIVGLFLIIASSFLTLANGGEDWEFYERELLSGENVLVQTPEWESSGRCIPRFDFFEPAMKVSLFDSRENTLATMVCDDGTDCILAIPSFAGCVAFSADESDGSPAEPAVSCTNDLPVYEPMPDDEDEMDESARNIKECNDEFTLRLDYENGSSNEVKYRQLFVHDKFEGYGCLYPY